MKMMYSNIDPKKHAVFTGEMYGTKVSVELDHSDISMDEMFEAFKTIAIGLGFGDESWRNGIKELAEQYSEEEDWDNTLKDGLEDEPPYISDDFQIGPNGAFEWSEDAVKEFAKHIEAPPPPNEELRKALKEREKND